MNADEKIKYLREDCIVWFVCPHCGEELYADSQNEPDECKCGFKYYLATAIKEVSFKGQTGLGQNCGCTI